MKKLYLTPLTFFVALWCFGAVNQINSSANGTIIDGYLIVEDFEGATASIGHQIIGGSGTTAINANPSGVGNSLLATNGGYSRWLQLSIILPVGKSLSDYESLYFDIYYGTSGDNTYKDVKYSFNNGSKIDIDKTQNNLGVWKTLSIDVDGLSIGNSFTFEVGYNSNQGGNFRIDNIKLSGAVPDGNVFTVTLNPGTGTCAFPSLTETEEGAGVTLPVASPSAKCVLNGYSFAGWATESIESTEVAPDMIAAGAWAISENTTLYAVYTDGVVYETNPRCSASLNGTVTDGWLMLEDFEAGDIGDELTVVAPYAINQNTFAKIAEDPKDDQQQVAHAVIKNWDEYLSIEVTLPNGKTLADYEKLDFDIYYNSVSGTDNGNKSFVLRFDAVPNEGNYFHKESTGGTSGHQTWMHKSIDLTGVSSDNTVTINLGIRSNNANYFVDNIKLKERLVGKNFSVTVPQGTQNVYVVGSFPGKEWDASDPYELTRVGTSNQFTGSFECDETVQYKYLNGKDWDYGEAKDDLELDGNGKPIGGPDRSYKENDVVEFWVASPSITLTASFPDGVDRPANLFVKGGWDDWAAKAMTKSGDTYSITINQKTYANTAYKYITDDITEGNWEIRKLPTTENPGNKNNDRWAIYPSMTDEIIGFVTDPMIYIGRKSINDLKLDTDLNISIPSGATVNYLLSKNNFSNEEPTTGYNSSSGIVITEADVYYLKNQIFHNDSSYFKQIPINLGPITWKDNGNTDWSTADNWTINSTVVNRSPITKEDVVIPSSLSNYPVLNTDAKIGSLEIQEGAKLTINTASELYVDGKITNNNGANGIIIKADKDEATGTLFFNNSENEPVLATVEIYARGSWDASSGKITNTKWQYFGIPFTHIHNIEHPFYGAIIREHNQAGTQSTSVLPNTTGKWIQLNNYSSLAPIKGYEIVQASPKKYCMSGTLYKDEFDYTVTYTPEVPLAGQHIISNPYMAAIPISDEAITFSENMDKTVYVYNTGSYSDFVGNTSKTGNNAGQYTASPLYITNSSSGIPDEIAPMQGFLVRTDKDVTSDGSISVSYSNLKKNTAIHKAPKAPQPWLRLIVDAESGGDALWLFINPDTSPAFDNGWDARKMGSEVVYPMIFSYNQTGNYQINTMDDIDGTDIAFRAGNADTEYTITFNHGDGMMDNYVEVYLEDFETETWIDISEDGASYTFHSDNTNIHARFKIHAHKIVSEVKFKPVNPVYIYSEGRNLIINNVSKENFQVDLYDTLGYLMISYMSSAGSMQTYQLNVTQGTYIIKISNVDSRTWKVIVY